VLQDPAIPQGPSPRIRLYPRDRRRRKARQDSNPRLVPLASRRRIRRLRVTRPERPPSSMAGPTLATRRRR